MGFLFLPQGPPPFSLLAGQISSLRQPLHLGAVGRHLCWPNPTSSQFNSLHSDLLCIIESYELSIELWAYLGSHFSRAVLVISGFSVSFLIHPRRWEMRCTCVSTAIPLVLSHAISITRWDILGPTPGREHCKKCVASAWIIMYVNWPTGPW